MGAGDVKSDIRPILRAHYRSLTDQTTGRQRWQDHVWLGGLPLAAGAFAYLKAVRLPEAGSAGLLTVTGVLGAFLFSLMVSVADRATAWGETGPAPSPATSEHADYLVELSGNTGYASLMSILASVPLVVAAASHGTVLQVASAVGLALTAHLLTTLSMIMKRVFKLTSQTLTEIRTGARRPGTP